MIVSFSARRIAALLGVPASYGIAKGRSSKAGVLILIARNTPGLPYLTPLFLLFQWLRLIGTLVPLVITERQSWYASRPASSKPRRANWSKWRRSLAAIWQVFRYTGMPAACPGITVATIMALFLSAKNFVFGVGLAEPFDSHVTFRVV